MPCPSLPWPMNPLQGSGRVGALSLWCRCESLSSPHGTTPIPAEGSPASDPTRPIPAEGSPASSRIRTAPQRERSDTPDPRMQRVHRRAQGFARHHTDPRRGFAGERSDTPDPRTRFAGELKDSHGTTARALRHARSPQRVHRRAQGFARHHSESDPTRPIPVEGSSASSRIRTAQGWARHHSESAATRPIPAEGSSASSRIRTAPQRERSDTPDPCRGFISASSRIRTAPQRERSDTPDPCRGFIGELKDSHGTTARALRHARSPHRVRRRAQGFARHHSESAPTRPIPVEGSSASSRMGTAPQRERSDTPDPCRGFIGELKDSHGTTARALRHARSL